MNFNTYLDSAVNKNPNKTAIVYGDIPLTYAEFHERVCCLANAMRHFDLKLADRIGILSTNSSYYLEIVFACARLGLQIDFFNFRLTPAMTAELIDESGCPVLFVSDTRKESLSLIKEKITRPMDIILVGSSFADEEGIRYEELLKKGSPRCIPAVTDDDDVLFNLYTSGTTGKPKTAMLTHKNIISQCLVCIAETKWTSKDTFMHVLPQFHIAAQGSYNTLFLGGTLIVLDHFNPEEYLRCLKKHNVTRIGLTPHMLNLLLLTPDFNQKDYPCLQTVIYAGASMPREILELSKERLGCDYYAYYGMTEMSSIIGLLKPDDHTWLLSQPESQLVPVGRLALGSLMTIVNESGEEAALGEPGEIIAFGDGVMKGYRDLKLTQKAIVNGWFHTGDIGFRDKRGYFYLVDRKDDLFVSGGENIYPSEIEQAIRAIGEEIIDAVAVGVPDKIWGHSIQAVVVLAEGSTLDESAIIKQCKIQLASYKKPRKVYFWEELPRNANGKVQRKKIVEMIGSLERKQE